MKKEYDFTGVTGIRGKYHEAYRKGHTATVHNDDGTATVHYFTQEEGAVMLEPDVRKTEGSDLNSKGKQKGQISTLYLSLIHI